MRVSGVFIVLQPFFLHNFFRRAWLNRHALKLKQTSTHNHTQHQVGCLRSFFLSPCSSLQSFFVAFALMLLHRSCFFSLYLLWWTPAQRASLKKSNTQNTDKTTKQESTRFFFPPLSLFGVRTIFSFPLFSPLFLFFVGAAKEGLRFILRWCPSL